MIFRGARDNWEGRAARLVVTGAVSGGRARQSLMAIAEAVFAGIVLVAIIYGLWL